MSKHLRQEAERRGWWWVGGSAQVLDALIFPGPQAVELRDGRGGAEGSGRRAACSWGRRSGEVCTFVKRQCQGISWNTMVTDTKQR